MENFPDRKYLEKLNKHLKSKTEKFLSQNLAEQFLNSSGILLNWIADYLTDPNIRWEKEELEIDQLYLTGTSPAWNKIIIDQCQRSPSKLRTLFRKNPSIKKIFKEAKFIDLPILVRYEEDKYKVLDGMHRIIAAIRDGLSLIPAFVAYPQAEPQPSCEAHLIYDFLRAYQRRSPVERQSLRTDLISGLRFLKKVYGNVEGLLRERFNSNYVLDPEIQEIIKEVLKD